MPERQISSSFLRIFYTFLFSCLTVIAYGQTLAGHYIIAFDLSTPRYSDSYLSPSILGKLDAVLKENRYKKGEDYISVLGYSLEHEPSIERFVRPYRDISGNGILWKNYKNPLSINMKNWPMGQPGLNNEKGPASSMQSLAKPYSIMATKTSGDSARRVDRTILLLVTDEVVNGSDDDYRQEWNRVKGIAGSEIPVYNRIEDKVFSTMRKFNEEFKFVQIPLVHAGKSRDFIPLSNDGRYKVVGYEVLPAEIPSIHSVTDMPSPLPLKRVRGGVRVNTAVSSVNPKYSIRDIIVTDKNGELLGRSSDGTFDFLIPSGSISEGDSINVSMSLILKDGLYNGSVISYKNDRFKSGMTHRQEFRLPEEGKVLGIFPLHDFFWWWFPTDATKAILLWDVVIILIFIALIMYLIKKFSAYRPSSEKITFHPVRPINKDKE